MTEPTRDQQDHDPLDYDWGICEPEAIGYGDLPLFAEVHRIVSQAAELAGSAPAAGSPQWWSAGPLARLAGLLVLAERYLQEDPHAIAARLLKDVSVDLSTSRDWSRSAVLPSHHELVRRRAEPGPLAQLAGFDPVAAARWVETGSSEEPAA